MSKVKGGVVRVPRGDQAVSLLIEIGLIGFVWWYLTLDSLFAGLLLLLVIVSSFLAVGWSRLVSGVGLALLGLLARMKYGQDTLGLVLIVLGAAMAVIGAIQLKGALSGRHVDS